LLAPPSATAGRRLADPGIDRASAVTNGVSALTQPAAAPHGLALRGWGSVLPLASANAWPSSAAQVRLDGVCTYLRDCHLLL
jgi:hypothetical protein